MNLNPVQLLHPVFNALAAPILNYGVYCSLVFVWPSLGAIAWVLGGGLRRKRSQGRPATVNSGIIYTTSPPNQSPPPTVMTEIDPVQNDANEIMNEP
jgi:hypothetical protein